jgi:hypothetical protein
MAINLFPSGSRMSRSLFDREKDAYSATDIEAVIIGTDKSTGKDKIVRIGDIQTLTYSIHRDASPVRTLGRSGPTAYTMGARTIAGTMIFATFNKRALLDLYSGATEIDLTGTLPEDNKEPISSARILKPSDTILPFDIILYFASEGGNDSVMVIYRVQLFSEGQTFSIQDVYTEHTMQYVAAGISMMEKVDDIWKKGTIGEGDVFRNTNLIRRAQSTGLEL